MSCFSRIHRGVEYVFDYDISTEVSIVMSYEQWRLLILKDLFYSQ